MVVFFLRQSFALVAQAGGQWCNLGLPQPLPSGFKHSPASASWVAGITGVCYHAQLLFVFLVETGFHHVDQAGLELLTSIGLPHRAHKLLGLQAWATTPGFSLYFVSSHIPLYEAAQQSEKKTAFEIRMAAGTVHKTWLTNVWYWKFFKPLFLLNKGN